MRDVVIVGGGLSGLSAAFELERRGIPYRLIEVKNRLGGSIVSERRAGFVLDGGPFAFERTDNWAFLSELGLEGAFCPVTDSHQRDLVAFRDGTQAVIEALAKRITGAVIHRMAVSSVGTMDGRFSICMENGLVFDAGALVLAAPARFVERMLRTLQPELSLRLLDYEYDTISRVTLGYRQQDITLPPPLPWDMALPFDCWTQDSQRVPAGHVLFHAGLRIPLERSTPEALIQSVHERIDARDKPVISRVDYWPEADPLPPHRRGFRTKMRELLTMLPDGVALAGSDYHGLSLSERFNNGRSAARQVARWLEKSS